MTTVRVCPTCGETDEDPRYWSARCEAAWAALQATPA